MVVGIGQIQYSRTSLSIKGITVKLLNDAENWDILNAAITKFPEISEVKQIVQFVIDEVEKVINGHIK